MTINQGTDAIITVTDTGGTPRNLSQWVNKIDSSWERATSEITTMGAKAVTRSQGLEDGSFSLAGVFDNAGTATPDQWLKGLQAGTVPTTFVIADGGSAAGLPFDTGTAILTSYAKSAPVDDVVSWTADFDCSDRGGVTRGTF